MKEQSVAKGFAVLSAAGIIVKVVSLLYLPFLLAIIGDAGNGVYVAAYQVYSVCVCFDKLGNTCSHIQTGFGAYCSG
jgi:stage V sporulation protein B